MIKELINNLSPAPLAALENISTDAALLGKAIERCRTTAWSWNLENVSQELAHFSKRVRDRAEIVGYDSVARILSDPVPTCIETGSQTMATVMKAVDTWIDGIQRKIAREIERRERKQFFSVSVLAPLVSVVVSSLSVVVAMIGVLVNALWRH